MTFRRKPLSAALASLLLALPALGAPAAADDLSPTELRLQERSRAANFYKAWFPDIGSARKAAISFHNQLIEANYGTGYLLMELQPEDIAALQRFGFRIEPAPEVGQRHRAMLDAIDAATAQQIGRAHV